MTGLYSELGQRHSFLLGLAVAEGQALAGPKGEGQHLIRKWHKLSQERIRVIGVVGMQMDGEPEGHARLLYTEMLLKCGSQTCSS